MDERPGARDLPTTTRVTPEMRGRALPLPPLVPLVGALGVFLGFVLGIALAPRGYPLPASSPAAIAAESPSFADAPVVTRGPTASPLGGPVSAGLPVEIPPTDGLSLAQALDAMRASRAGESVQAVISARVVRLAELSSSTASGDRWVWAIVIGGAFPLSCGSRPQDAPAPCPWTTTERIVIDYHTGALLEP